MPSYNALGYLNLLLLLLLFNGVPATVEEKAEKDTTVLTTLPKVTVPISYEIELNPELVEGDSVFHGESKIAVKIIKQTPTITLHSRSLVIDEEYTSLISAQGFTRKAKKHSYEEKTNFLIITFDQPITIGNYTLNLKYTGNLTNETKGIYKNSYDENGKTRWLVLSEFVPNYASMAFPCWDEPGSKATFNLSIKHHSDYTAVSNMPVHTKYMDTDGKQWTNFQVTPLMSTYELAFVVSDLDCLREENEKISFCGREDTLPYLKHARDVSERALPVLEKYMDAKYNLPKLDQLALPGMQQASGLWSSWGLITYGEMAVVYKPFNSSAQTKELVAFSVAEALTQQWIGNMITPASWKYFWIITGLSNYFKFYLVDKLYPEWDVWDRAINIKIHELSFYGNLEAYKPIDGDTSNKLPDTSCSQQSEIAAASIFHMMSSIITEEVFKAGIAKLIKKNENGSITADDFWNSMQSAYNEKKRPNLSIKEIMQPWMQQRGYPVINVTRDYQTGRVTITQQSSIRNESQTSNRWWIPINFATQSNPNFESTLPTHWLKPHEDSLIIDEVSKDDWIIVNIQQSGFYVVDYDKTNWKRIANYMNTDNYKKIHVRNRMQLIDDLTYLVKGKNQDVSIMMDLSAYLAREDDYRPWRSIMHFISILTHYTYDEAVVQELNKFYLSMLEKMIKMFGYEDRRSYDWITKYKSYYDELDYKTKKFVPTEKAIEKVYKSEDFVKQHNRRYFLVLACRLGDKLCQNSARNQLRDNLKNQAENPISGNLARWVRCFGAEGNEEELIKLVYASPTRYYFTYVSCSSNKTALRNYVEKALAGQLNITSDDTIDAIIYLISHSNRTVVNEAVNYLINNFGKIYKYFKENPNSEDLTLSPEDRITWILEYYISETDQLAKIKELIDRESSRINPRIKDVIESQTIQIRESEARTAILRNWLRDNAPKVGATASKNQSKSRG